MSFQVLNTYKIIQLNILILNYILPFEYNYTEAIHKKVVIWCSAVFIINGLLNISIVLKK